MNDRRIFWGHIKATARVGEYACEIEYCPNNKGRRRWYWRIDKAGVDHASRFMRHGWSTTQDAARRHVRTALIERGLDLVWGDR